MNEKNIVMLVSYLVIIMFIIYFFIYLPNKKKHSVQQKMHENLKVGDKVVTIGGIVGEIYSREGDYLKIIVDKEKEVKICIIVYAVREVINSKGGTI